MNHKDILEINIIALEKQLQNIESTQKYNHNWNIDYYNVLIRLAIARSMLNEVTL